MFPAGPFLKQSGKLCEETNRFRAGILGLAQLRLMSGQVCRRVQGVWQETFYSLLVGTS